MKIDFYSIVPIYIQIADAIEDDILYGRLEEGENCYSQLTISKELNINPATAAKGIRVLVDRGILEKQRGLAMTVVTGAREKIRQRKMEEKFSTMIVTLIAEADKLGITQDQMIRMIQEKYKAGTNSGSSDGQEKE